RHAEDHGYGMRDVLGGYLPTAIARGVSEVGVDTAGHNRSDADLVVAMVEHHGFGEEIEARLRRIIGSASGERVLAGETRDVDDEAAAAGETGERFAGTIEGTVQVEVDIAMPVFG